MIRYQAPNPYTQVNSFFTPFSSLFSSASSGSRSIGKLILPAQWRSPEILNTFYVKRLEAYKALAIEGGFIGTHDEAILDTIQLTPISEIYKSENNKSYLIKFNGNGGQYQDLFQEYGTDAANLQATVIGFNYRGVGLSKKTPERFQDLVTDGIAQVQRLLDKGVPSTKILLDGHSLGGGIATMVAYHFHQLRQPVYLWNDRSFAALSKAAAGILAPKLPGLLGDAVESSFESTSWSLMKPTGWDVDVAKAYNAIPAKYKGYMVVAKKSNKSWGDGVISHPASLHKGVKKFEQQQHIKTGFKFFSIDEPGHNASRSSLIAKNDNSKNAQMVFENFAKGKGIGR